MLSVCDRHGACSPPAFSETVIVQPAVDDAAAVALVQKLIAQAVDESTDVRALIGTHFMRRQHICRVSTNGRTARAPVQYNIAWR
jgi:hypothetical protein